MTPSRVDITLRRNAPFVEEWGFVDTNGNPIAMLGWTAKMELRLYGAQPGDALVSLATVTTQIQGVYFFPSDQTRLRVQIDESSVAALPGPAEAGDPISFVYDLALIDPTGFRQIFREGAVVTLPGVTVA